MRGLGVLVLSCAVAACSDREGAAFDRQAMLRDVATLVYLPIYRDLHDRAETLSETGETLCEARDEPSLGALQQAWREVRVPWQMAEAFPIGPVVDQHIDGALDFWPLRQEDVEEVLAGSEPIDDAYVDALGGTRKGLPVIEYLAFDPAGDDAAIVAELDDGGAPSRRCQYLAALARDAEQQTGALVAAWEPEQGNFAGEVVNAGQGSTTFGKTSEAFEAVANGLVTLASQMESTKLGKPLGKQSGGVVQPDAVEAPISGNATADLVANLDGIEAVYLARYQSGDGVGLSDAVRFSRADLDPSISAQIDAAREAVLAIELPLAESLASDPAPVEAAFVACKDLFRLLAADMSSALGTTPTFGDTDGD